ncbi:MAG: hypothetical protein QM501_00045 [Gimesia sp.]
MNASFALLIGLSVWQSDGEVITADTVRAPATIALASAECTYPASHSCMAGNGADLCQSGNGLCDACGSGFCNGCCHLKKHGWLNISTSGDMYPHYPYTPAYHGYYYFRPYNYSNILRQKGEVVALGGDPKAPYSHKMFIPIYEQIDLTSYEEFPSNGQSVPILEPINTPLPSLEEILKSK